MPVTRNVTRRRPQGRATSAPPSLPDLPADLELGYTLFRLARLIARDSAKALARHVDLTIAEWRLLMVLRDDTALQFDRTADLALLEKSHASLAARRLLERKLIEQVPDPEDGRRTLLKRRAAGKRLMEKFLHSTADGRAALWGTLSRREARSFHGALLRLLERAEELAK